MAETRVSMSELRQRLGDLVNRAAYGGERIVLVAHGQPKAAIIGVEDLRRLQEQSKESTSLEERYRESLAAADLIRKKIKEWQEAHGIQPEDSTETLRQLREARDDELSNLR
jgi:prevent-host-death family protein